MFGCAPAKAPVPAGETPTTTAPPPTPTPAKPQVFEKDTQGICSTAWYRYKSGETTPLREAQTLRFDLIAGNRVDGEVTICEANEDGTTTPIQGRVMVFAFVIDPNGNIVLQTSAPGTIPPELSGMHTTQTYPTQTYPWRFSFIAATTGEFSLEVNTGRWETSPIYVAHLKVTIYDR
jgi:hypothetical protein